MVAGRVAAPVAILIASGRAASVKTSAAMAPACCTLLILSSKKQTPRRMRAIDPERLPLGKEPHAMPLESNWATSARGPEIGVRELGPSPGKARIGAIPPT